MASPLRSPWVAAALSVGAVAFLVWRLLPMFHSTGSISPPVATSAVPEVALATPSVDPPAVVESDSAILPLSEDQTRDSLGGWDVAMVRDPFQRQHRHAVVRVAHRVSQAATFKSTARLGSRAPVRGLATGVTNLVLAQGRVLAEGDTLAGGVLRAIRSDRILIRRSNGDTVIFLPRGTFP